MRLFSHNLLMCPQENCKLIGFPLMIDVVKAQYKESSYNRDKLIKVAQKLDWPGLKKTVLSLGQQNFPEGLYDILDNDEALRRLHRYIYDVNESLCRLI